MHPPACELTVAVVAPFYLWHIFGRDVGLMTWIPSIPYCGRSSTLWFTWLRPLLTLMSGSPVTCGSTSCHCVLWSLVLKLLPRIERSSDTLEGPGSGP